MAFSLHFVFYLTLYIYALVANKRVHKSFSSMSVKRTVSESALESAYLKTQITFCIADFFRKLQSRSFLFICLL